MDYRKEYERWMKQAAMDEDIVEELRSMDDAKMEDAFYRDLAFGTGGLRGVIGAGTNRINIYTIAKASQGLADYLKKNFEEPSVAIGYDSRIKSDVFARTAAGVFAANGVRVSIWPVLMPVPTVSFAARYLHTSAGVMITASHNPSKYNGYKVYGPDGCQITVEAADNILKEIEKLDIFADVRNSDFETGIANGSIQYIQDEVFTAFIEQVKSQSVLFGEEVDKNIAIVYSPLNGSGLKPVTRTLKEMGYTNITVVREQEQPDGRFPTCPYPNPEIKEAMALGIEYAKRCNADLMLATDPDCDRVGIAVKNHVGEYELLTGNQTGMLLLDYICSQRQKHHKMPADPVMVKTIVTMDMAQQIAEHYGLRTINVLTGFKFIGEQIGKLEEQKKADSYVFGFEESYGYLTGSYVRDKDGVNGACIICEMFSYYATKGIGLSITVWAEEYDSTSEAQKNESEENSEYSDFVKYMYKFTTGSSYKYLVISSNFSYMKFVSEFRSNVAELYLIEMVDRLAKTGAAPDVNAYIEALANIITIYDRENASSVAEQKKMDNLKDWRSYTGDVISIATDAVSVYTGLYPSDSEIADGLETAIDVLTTEYDNINNWIDTLAFITKIA